MNSMSMSAVEKRAAVSLSAVFFLRMLPLFMLLPVLALAGDDYQHSTPQLLGLALGIYGLTQAGLQIPFGMLSDRWGRKPIIITGLVIFLLGSLLAATSNSVYGLILGRALQGAGAVAAAIMALAADLTTEQHRTQIMAGIGMSIGMAFAAAFVLGPLLYTLIDIRGLFYLGSALAILAILTLVILVPKPKTRSHHTQTTLHNLTRVISNLHLLRLNISIFCSHLILMANFVVIPVVLRDQLHLSTTSHWQVYLGVLFASLFIFVPFIIFGERLKKAKFFFMISIGLIGLSQIGLSLTTLNLNMLAAYLVLFFGAFNYLEALLPSEVSKTASAEAKGTALGVYSSSQFIGIFIGGLCGGFIQQHFGILHVHLCCLIIVLFWFVTITLLPQGEQNFKNKLEEKIV